MAMQASLPCLPKLDKKSGKYCTTWTAKYPKGHPRAGESFTDYMSFETKDLDRANERYVKFLVDRTKQQEDKGTGRRTVHWCLDYYLTRHIMSDKVTAPKGVTRAIAMWKAFFPATKMAHDINRPPPDDEKAELDLDRWERLRKRDRKFNKGNHLKKDGTPKSNKPIMPGTMRYERSVLDTAINYCIDKGVLSNLDRPKIEIGDQPKSRSGTIDEDQFLTLAALLENANSPAIHGRTGKLSGIAIWAWIMFETGCRSNEAKYLEWDKVDLDKAREIDFTIDGRPETHKVRNPEAPITDALLAVLRRAKAERCSKWVCIKPVNFGDGFKNYCEKAGFPITGPKRITAHSMRHSRITLAVASGMPATEVSDLFKIDIKTLMKNYYHGTKKRRAENANRSSDQKKLLGASIKAVK